jgi:diguanylate cyclase (GGDEF)-like protein
MEKSKNSELFFANYWLGWRKWAAWSICIGFIVLLGILRTGTGAEFTFASLVLFPVLLIAWIGGKRNGLIMAFLGAAIWVAADIATQETIAASWYPWINSLTRLLTYSLVAMLTAELRLLLNKEHEHATLDELTGLLNRRAFYDAGAAEVERSQRYGHSLAVAYLDLDNFKQLNDSRGHDAGDAALQATARALFGSLRSTDYISRMGGDEFAILLPEVEFDESEEAGRKILSAVNEALRKFPPVTGSVGLAWFGKVDRSFKTMLKAADELMYEAKASGKNSFLGKRVDAVEKSSAAPIENDTNSE